MKLFLLVCVIFLPQQADVPQHLYDVSVTIHTADQTGSGVVKTRRRGQEQLSFVWTAAHVVADVREEKNGEVSFKDVTLHRTFHHNGEESGKDETSAKVMLYAPGEDLALLRVKRVNYSKSSVCFYSGKESPKLGTKLWHVGSFYGLEGSNSLSDGVLSYRGRKVDDTLYDQTTVTSYPGASGGGVFLQDGRCIGLMIRGRLSSCNWIVPIRRMRAWAHKQHVTWALDDSVPVPSETELDRILVEEPEYTYE